jgi:small subunit ribosomal protein S16
MLKMRLQRVGRKHEPSFRLVLTDSKNSTKSGRFKEILGSFDPRKTTEAFKTDRINYWLSQGVTPTDTVHNLFVTHKIIDAKKKNVLPKKTPIVKAPEPVAEVVPEPTPVVETPVEAPTPEVVEEAPIKSAPEPETVVETPAELAPEVSPEDPTEEVVQ